MLICTTARDSLKPPLCCLLGAHSKIEMIKAQERVCMFLHHALEIHPCILKCDKTTPLSPWRAFEMIKTKLILLLIPLLPSILIMQLIPNHKCLPIQTKRISFLSTNSNQRTSSIVWFDHLFLEYCYFWNIPQHILSYNLLIFHDIRPYSSNCGWWFSPKIQPWCWNKVQQTELTLVASDV